MTMSQEKEVADRIAKADIVLKRLRKDWPMRSKHAVDYDKLRQQRVDAADLIEWLLTALRTAREEGYRQGVGDAAGVAANGGQSPGDIYDAILALAEPVRQGVGARVKPLVWRKPADHPQDPEDAALVAVGIGGCYAISKPQLTTAFGPNGHLLWDAEDNFSFTEHRSIEAAQSAAQRDYEQRIMSALAEPGDGWFGMDSAPRDGTHFLAYEGTGDMYRAAFGNDGVLAAFCGQYVTQSPEPELWRPLPPLPTPPRIPSPGDTGE